MTRALDTAICRLFGIRYPIIQTGMGWVSGARLTAATSAATAVRPSERRLGIGRGSGSCGGVVSGDPHHRERDPNAYVPGPLGP